MGGKNTNLQAGTEQGHTCGSTHSCQLGLHYVMDNVLSPYSMLKSTIEVLELPYLQISRFALGVE